MRERVHVVGAGLRLRVHFHEAPVAVHVEGKHRQAVAVLVAHHHPPAGRVEVEVARKRPAARGDVLRGQLTRGRVDGVARQRVVAAVGDQQPAARRVQANFRRMGLVVVAAVESLRQRAQGLRVHQEGLARVSRGVVQGGVVPLCIAVSGAGGRHPVGMVREARHRRLELVDHVHHPVRGVEHQVPRPLRFLELHASTLLQGQPLRAREPVRPHHVRAQVRYQVHLRRPAAAAAGATAGCFDRSGGRVRLRHEAMGMRPPLAVGPMLDAVRLRVEHVLGAGLHVGVAHFLCFPCARGHRQH